MALEFRIRSVPSAQRGRTMAEQERIAVRIDPGTGQKLFDTRVTRASARVDGHGYEVVDDAELTSLPAFKVDAPFTAEEQARYREFNEVRRGSADYMAMDGQYVRYLEDHYSAAPVEREALTDD